MIDNDKIFKFAIGAITGYSADIFKKEFQNRYGVSLDNLNFIETHSFIDFLDSYDPEWDGTIDYALRLDELMESFGYSVCEFDEDFQRVRDLRFKYVTELESFILKHGNKLTDEFDTNHTSDKLAKYVDPNNEDDYAKGVIKDICGWVV